ncbi:hypothetical protein LUX39_15380 [Actinomadura madurae]|nr:hypothetical protein [Actinomadura madurae]MCQ0014954.1 hypothetical protein [Actinomadura madurae]
MSSSDSSSVSTRAWRTASTVGVRPETARWPFASSRSKRSATVMTRSAVFSWRRRRSSASRSGSSTVVFLSASTVCSRTCSETSSRTAVRARVSPAIRMAWAPQRSAARSISCATFFAFSFQTFSEERWKRDWFQSPAFTLRMGYSSSPSTSMCSCFPSAVTQSMAPPRRSTTASRCGNRSPRSAR